MSLSASHRHLAVAVPLFTATLFVSAFLLFLVQPMVAKMVLPLLGGSPMVWNTCMVFFQMALLAGYAYAHGATRWLDGRTQVALHLALLLLPFAVLPLFIGPDAAPPREAPVGWLLALLAGTIGLPFLVLATSASVLQHWFSRTDHPAAGDPYFLYVSSNVGSFVSLAAYPALVEPLLSLHDQSRLWTAGYALFVAMTALCALFAWRSQPAAAAAAAPAAPAAETVTLRRRAHWVLLAFIPSSLMLAVTTYLSTDIAAAPLLWIVPLGLYLLTFVGAFSARGPALHAVVRRLFPLLVVPLALCMGATGMLAFMFPLHVLTFVAAALLCHTRLAADRPAATHLTEFYLWISFGGMLGGLLNALAAPMLFDSILEYPIVLALACLALPVSQGRRATPPAVMRDVLVGAATLVLALGAVRAASLAGLSSHLVALGIPAFVVFTFKRQPFRFALGVSALFAATLTANSATQPVLHAERTFFGVYRVTEDRKAEYRALAHGTTLHGMQALQGDERGEPLTYFHREGPFGQAFSAVSASIPRERIAVIGLGVGTLAAYAQPGHQWTFYEIDGAVERIARDQRHFNYLSACGGACRVEVGDARLSLAKAPERHYDVLVLDAFSSDSIPVHLLTSEAVARYLQHLKEDGVLLFHISNRHLKLWPIVGRLAERHGLTAVMNFDRRKPEWPRSRFESIWVAMSARPEHLGPLTRDARWYAVETPPGTPLWTDDFSNILSVLHFR